MRFARIDLSRYGHLTDVSVTLPASGPDFHIVVADNEFGKSTTQAALTDLLFGFGHKTDYAFMHHERDLRVGALIEDGTGCLEAWRKKGRKDTLRGPGECVVDEALLARLLVGISRDAFVGQFSLNHERLRTGGRAILEAKDDLGRMLFQAGAGLEWLSDRLRALEAEAGELFRPRGSSQVLARALQRRDKAYKTLKDAAGSAREFQEARRSAEETAARLDQRKKDRAEVLSRSALLTRAQRVIPILRALDGLAAGIEQIGTVPELPAGFRQRLQKAVDGHAETRRKVDGARAELEQANAKLALLTVDEAVLARALEIDLLNDQVGALIKADGDLPRREAELAGHEESLVRHLREVGRTELTPQTIGEHLLTRQNTETLRRHAREHARLIQAYETARTEAAATRGAVEKARSQFDAIPPARDPEPLRVALKAAERDAGLAERLRQDGETVAKLRETIAKKRAAMVPVPPPELMRAALPSIARVKTEAEQLKAIDQQLADLRKEIAKTAADLSIKNAERLALLAAGSAIPPERLRAARDHRDRGWQLVRQQYIAAVAPDPDAIAGFAGAIALPEAFEAALVEADRVADHRFDAAETSARLSNSVIAIAGLETGLAGLRQREAAVASERSELLARWQAEWRAHTIVPEAPAAMADWLDRLVELEALQFDLARAEQKAAETRITEGAVRDRLAVALTALGTPTGAGSLIEVTRTARDRLDELTRQGLERKQADKSLAERTEAAESKAAALNQIGLALDQWRKDWALVMAGINRPADTDPADLESFLTGWEAIREAHDKAADLRHRIGTMRRDQTDFAERIGRLVLDLAPELADRPAVDAARALMVRLNKARTDQLRRKEAVSEVERRDQALAAAIQAEHAALTVLRDGLALTGANSVDAAWPVVENSEQLARLGEERGHKYLALAQAGEGRLERDLRAECHDLDPDRLPALIAELTARDAELVEEIGQLNRELGIARERLAPFDQASTRAAEAAEDAAQATSEAVRTAERYLRVQTTALVLRHAIERYRQENEGPLLGQASERFNALTLGRYARLAIDHDSGDKPQLLVQPGDGGRSFPVDGLSDGARDQLFLSLRLAAINQVLQSGTVLPFIADDLFINFDDPRTVAGLEQLAELATRTQVLLFTHHHHLADLAERHLQGRFHRTSFVRA